MDTKRKRRVLSLTVDEKRQRQNRLNRIIRYNAKKEAIEYMGGKCVRCGGEFHTSAFDFHHRNPEEKDVDPGALVRRNKDALYAELAKCDLVCANCHRIIHWEWSNADTDWDEAPIPRLSLTVDGETKTLTEWADAAGLNYETLRARVFDFGWDHERAVRTPLLRRNTNKHHVITALGKTANIQQWSRETGIPAGTIRGRIRLGWDSDRAVTEPPRKMRTYDGSSLRG